MNSTSTTISTTLTKVAADHKLNAATEIFLLQGRLNKKFPQKPYYHVTMSKAELANTLPSELNGINAVTKAALLKLWNNAATDYLKEKAAPLDAGATITVTIATNDILTFIEEAGNRERSAISGEDIDNYCASYAFSALAIVNNWTAQQVARVAVALRQYAAPAHKKSQADAGILSTRLAALPTLLTGEDATADDEILASHNWLASKLTRDAATEAVNLADAI